MKHKAFATLIILCLSLSSSSSSSSSYSSSSSSSSSSDKEGKTKENIKLSPPFLFLSRLLSSASVGQRDSAGLESSLLSLNNLLSAVDEEIKKLDKEGEEKNAIENGITSRDVAFEKEVERGKEEEEEEEEGRNIGGNGGSEGGNGGKQMKEEESGGKEQGTQEERGEMERMEELTKKRREISKINERNIKEEEEEEVGGGGGIESEEEKGGKMAEQEKAEKESERRKMTKENNKEEKINEKESNEKENENTEKEEEREEDEDGREREIKENGKKKEGKEENTNEELRLRMELKKTRNAKKEENEEKEGKLRKADEERPKEKGEEEEEKEEVEEEEEEEEEEVEEEERKVKNQSKWNPPGLDNWIEQIKEKLKEILAQLKNTLNTSFHHVIWYYLPNNSTGAISEDCAIDVDDDSILAPVNRKGFLKMFDAWGKIPDGFLWGNIKVPGMFEECVRLQVSSLANVEGENVTREYTGRYCTVRYRPNSTESEEEEEERAVLPGVRSGVSLATLANPIPFSYGTCIPSTCTAEDLQASLAGVLAQDGLEVAGVECQVEGEEGPVYTPEDKAFISIVSIFGILVVLGTAYEVIVMARNISSFEALLNFSLLHNLSRIFSYENGKETGDVITCLPMLRVVTMLWIIICHQYETNATFVVNLFDSLSYQEPAIAQIVTNGWLSVDTFFFMAGLILTFRLVPYLRPDASLATNIKTLATVIVRRIMRLAPVILVVALFCASLLQYLAEGPNAGVLESYSQDTCRKHWWKDPLFINNYLFPGNEGDDVNDCLSHCWYTAVDVQLLLLLPLIFLPALYHQLAGIAVLCILTVGSIVIPLAITLAYELPPSPLHNVFGEERLTYMTHVFMAPWCRMGPWLVGAWTGLLLRTSRAQRLRMNKLVVFIGYIVAIGIGFILVIGLLPYNRLHFSHELVERDWKEYPVMAAFYGSLARPTWGLCVAWVVFTCHTGNAGIINHILSYPGWLPVARLTFAIYIVAPVVQLWWAAGLLTPTYYNYMSKLFESAGVFSISLLLAIILTCLVELPVISTCNLFLPSPAKKHEREVMARKENKDNNLKDGWNDKYHRGKVFPS